MFGKILKLWTVLILLIVIPSCTSERITKYENEPLPTKIDGSAYTKEQITAAIMKACQRRGWVAQVREEGIIYASIIVRSNKAEAEISYDQNRISIVPVVSKNKDSYARADYRYWNRWVSFLFSSIIEYLSSSSEP